MSFQMSDPVQRWLLQTPLEIHITLSRKHYTLLCSFHTIFQQIKTCLLEALKRFQMVLGPLTELLFPSEREKRGLFQLQMRGLWECPTLLCVPWYGNTPGRRRLCKATPRPKQPNPYKQGWNDADRILLMGLLVKLILWSPVQWQVLWRGYHAFIPSTLTILSTDWNIYRERGLSFVVKKVNSSKNKREFCDFN